MKKRLDSYKEKLRKFQQNEDGLEALQVVLIIAVAAILLVGIFSAVRWAMKFFKEKGDELDSGAQSTQAETWD